MGVTLFVKIYSKIFIKVSRITPPLEFKIKVSKCLKRGYKNDNKTGVKCMGSLEGTALFVENITT